MDPYVSLAKTSVESYVKTGKVCDIPEGLPSEMYDKRAGVFVSIHKTGGALRGCIGTIYPVTSCIAEEIIDNAVSASTRDPRFDPIIPSELDSLVINVDVLTEPEEISSPDMLDPKRYGVIVTSGFKRGLLLPDLPGVDTVQKQIIIASSKAGITSDEKVSLMRFEVIRHT
jgi:AmmeMemoRadiSam system protein A